MQPTRCLLDHDIREALKKALHQQDRTAAIIEELPLLRGRGKADLAFVNGELCGYEIKSEADSLVRLGIQADNYGTVFEFNTLVAAKKHLKLAKRRLPKTWGIIEARDVNGRIELHPQRQAKRNRSLHNAALARLLWKSECVYILKKTSRHIRPNAAVIELWNVLECLPTDQLCNEVREALKRRQAKADRQRTPCDDLHTTAPIVSDHLGLRLDH